MITNLTCSALQHTHATKHAQQSLEGAGAAHARSAEVEPGRSPRVPGGHRAHIEAALAPRAALKVPGAHGIAGDGPTRLACSERRVLRRVPSRKLVWVVTKLSGIIFSFLT